MRSCQASCRATLIAPFGVGVKQEGRMPGKPSERFGFEPRGGEVREGGSSVGWGRGTCCFPTVHCQCPAPSPGHTEWLQKQWPVLMHCCGRIHRDNFFGKLTTGSTACTSPPQCVPRRSGCTRPPGVTDASTHSHAVCNKPTLETTQCPPTGDSLDKLTLLFYFCCCLFFRLV